MTYQTHHFTFRRIILVWSDHEEGKEQHLCQSFPFPHPFLSHFESYPLYRPTSKCQKTTPRPFPFPYPFPCPFETHFVPHPEKKCQKTTLIFVPISIPSSSPNSPAVTPDHRGLQEVTLTSFPYINSCGSTAEASYQKVAKTQHLRHTFPYLFLFQSRNSPERNT